MNSSTEKAICTFGICQRHLEHYYFNSLLRVWNRTLMHTAQTKRSRAVPAKKKSNEPIICIYTSSSRQSQNAPSEKPPFLPKAHYSCVRFFVFLFAYRRVSAQANFQRRKNIRERKKKKKRNQNACAIPNMNNQVEVEKPFREKTNGNKGQPAVVNHTEMVLKKKKKKMFCYPRTPFWSYYLHWHTNL